MKTWTEASEPARSGEYERWEGLFSRPGYLYGEEPGPVARRAVRYHSDYRAMPASAVDIACGEGQDLAYLAGQGYRVEGFDFSPSAVAKSKQLLARRGLTGNVELADLTRWCGGSYDLVICSNCLQFLGPAGESALASVRDSVRRNGVLGLSLLGLEQGETETRGSMWRVSLPWLLEQFPGWQPLEAARLHQWDSSGRSAQLFVTLVIRRT